MSSYLIIYFTTVGDYEMENRCSDNIDSEMSSDELVSPAGDSDGSNSNNSSTMFSDDDYDSQEYEDSDNNCEEVHKAQHSDHDSATLAVLSCFLRNNLSASASKDILKTFKTVFPQISPLQEITYETIWSKIDCSGVKEYHYCTTCNALFPFMDENVFKCTDHCPGLRYKGAIEDQLKVGRQPRGSFVLADIEKQLKHLLQTPGKLLYVRSSTN